MPPIKKEQPKRYWYTPIENFAKRHSWIIGIIIYIFVQAGNKYFENENRMNIIETEIAVLKVRMDDCN